MDGLVVGSQIQCYSPAAKEVPRIITENGECSPEATRGVGGVCLPSAWRELRTDVEGLEEPTGGSGQRKAVLGGYVTGRGR